MTRQRRAAYPTDLSDAEWQKIEPLLPAPNIEGHPRVYELREVLNAIFYLLQTGCTWRMLPHDLPPWQTVYGYFYTWRKSGLFERINATLQRDIIEPVVKPKSRAL